MDDVIRVFVGADRSQALAVETLAWSIHRHTDRTVEVRTLLGVDLPEPKDLRQGSRTNFSFARFAIPELTGWQGRAIYLDADMQVFRDIGELWDIPMNGAKILIQEEIPEALAEPNKVGAPSRRIKQCSVMVIDCAATGWNVRDIVAGLDGQYTYEELMYHMCILKEDEVGYRVPFHWNSLEHFDENTGLIHYTDMNTQPWVSPDNVLGPIWLRLVNEMLAEGALALSTLQTEIDLGYFRPSLIDELRDMPHEQGFDPEAAARYAVLDRKAGFIKHAEVYSRKRERERLVKAALAAAAEPGLLGI